MDVSKQTVLCALLSGWCPCSNELYGTGGSAPLFSEMLFPWVIPLVFWSPRKGVWALKWERTIFTRVTWGEKGKWQYTGCVDSWAAEHRKCSKYQMCKLKLPQGSLILYGRNWHSAETGRNGPWQRRRRSSLSRTSCSEQFIARVSLRLLRC